MPYNIRIVSTYPPRRCGIGTFSRDLANALEHFTGEVGHIRVAAIDNGSGPYAIPVDLVLDQYNSESWAFAIADILARANESANPPLSCSSTNMALTRPKTAGTARASISSRWQRHFTSTA